nr:MAG TPA: hypothetical protein [Caudoviricetes sp.]
MAANLLLVDGSIFNGNPITFAVTPLTLGGTPSFHRMVFEVKCGVSGGNYETIRMTEPVLTENGKAVQIDISSALRSFRDSYEYSPEPGVMPVVKFNVSAYDEYMLNGEVKKSEPVSYLSGLNPGMNVRQTIFGGFSDYDRLTGGQDMKVSRLTRKPNTTPQLVCVGEQLIYTEDYSPAVSLPTPTWAAPEAKAFNIVTEGAQTVGGQQLYALPASEATRRTEFRFINSFGVLESISIPKSYAQEVDIKATNYIVTRKETLHSFSRSAVRKQGNKEGWNYMTDPLDETWLAWYLHELLMSEHVWLKINGKFLPCTIESEETIKYADDTKDDIYSVSFTARLNFCGSTKI